MRLTPRDVKLLRDLTLSRVLTGSQMRRLGYFGSETRCNTRLRELRHARLVHVLDTPFSREWLYAPAQASRPLVGDRVAAHAPIGTSSPLYLRHCLLCTEVRLALALRGFPDWRFEPQVRALLTHGTERLLLRPDGCAIGQAGATLVEVDLGHVSHRRMRRRLFAYRDGFASPAIRGAFGELALALLVCTTTARRAGHLQSLLPQEQMHGIHIVTYAKLGIEPIGVWS